MIEVVIIGRNEGESVSKMIDSLPKNWGIVYVADRCTDNTIGLLSEYDNVRVLDTTPMSLSGRQTSFCRNLGLSVCSSESDILFLDGDRYVVSGDIRKELEGADTDIVLLKLENDLRDSLMERNNADFSDLYGYLMSGFYSCGIFFRREAIERVREHTLMRGQLFPEFLQSHWGIEDTSLGDLCYSIGLTASLNDNVRLRGEFEKQILDSVSTLGERLSFRNKLRPNIRWINGKMM